MKQGNLSFDELLKLVDKYIDHYESKKGLNYVQGLKDVFGDKNRNDRPFIIEDILKCPTLEDFWLDGMNEFEYCCILKADPMILYKTGERKSNEKIIASSFANQKMLDVFKLSKGVAYMMTCEINKKEYIIKFGQTRNTFKDRLQSYNCGSVNNWRTASTTNIKILQSFVATRLPFKLYLRDCSEDNVTYVWSGIKSIPFASALSLAIEDIVVKEYVKKFGKPPLANVQANATDID